MTADMIENTVIVFTVSMSLADTTSNLIVQRVLQLTRRRQFLVWYADSPATREVGLPIPQETTPSALKRLLIRFNPTHHSVVNQVANEGLAALAGQLLVMGICLVKLTPHASVQVKTKNEYNRVKEKMRKRYNKYLKHSSIFDISLDNYMSLQGFSNQ